MTPNFKEDAVLYKIASLGYKECVNIFFQVSYCYGEKGMR